MKVKLLIITSAILALCFGVALGQNSITLDHVDGLVDGETTVLQMDVPITFYLRLNNAPAPNEGNIVGAANGFRVYSDDGAIWSPITFVPYWDLVSCFCVVVYYTGWDSPPNFNDNLFVNDYSITGEGADTIGFGGNSKFPSPGVLPGFSEVVYTISTQVAASEVGKTLCLDSSWYRPANTWLWSTDTGVFGDVKPEWDGPHCFTIGVGSAVTERESGLPNSFALGQNFPNPFNPTTTINFDLPVKSYVSIEIFNVLGQKVRTLVNQELAPGKYTEDWDSRTDAGSKVSSGIYFYKLTAENFVETKKMMLLK